MQVCALSRMLILYVFMGVLIFSYLQVSPNAVVSTKADKATVAIDHHMHDSFIYGVSYCFFCRRCVGGLLSQLLAAPPLTLP